MSRWHPTIEAGFLRRNGHARCGGCGMVEGRTPGGKAARKAGGWTYTGRNALGWVCRECARWVLSPAVPPPEASTSEVTPSSADQPRIVENSPRSIEQRSTLSRPKVTVSKAQARAARRRANQQRRRAENKAAGRPANSFDTSSWPSSRWQPWAKKRRAENRARERGESPKP